MHLARRGVDVFWAWAWAWAWPSFESSPFFGSLSYCDSSSYYHLLPPSQRKHTHLPTSTVCLRFMRGLVMDHHHHFEPKNFSSIVSKQHPHGKPVIYLLKTLYLSCFLVPSLVRSGSTSVQLVFLSSLLSLSLSLYIHSLHPFHALLSLSKPTVPLCFSTLHRILGVVLSLSQSDLCEPVEAWLCRAIA